MNPVEPPPAVGSAPEWVREESAHPVPSWAMEWRSERWDPLEARRFEVNEAQFLPFAAGPDGGALIGYVRGHTLVAETRRGELLAERAPDFEAFLRQLPGYFEDRREAWEAAMRAALATERGS